MDMETVGQVLAVLAFLAPATIPWIVRGYLARRSRRAGQEGTGAPPRHAPPGR